jgi:non-ribosomal peptide synthetase component F
VVGYFVNTLPLRARIAADMSFDALVAQLRDTVVGALDHQDLPFARIVEQVGHARDPRRAPLCQAMFQLQTHRPREGVGDVMRALSDNGAAALGQLTVERYELARRIAQFELSLDLTDFGAGIAGIWEYNTRLFEEDTIVGLIDDYLQLAADLTAEPARPIAAHALASARTAESGVLDERARAQVLVGWNDTAVRYPIGTVHGAIAAQAARSPDRIALRFEADTLTYGALEARANRIARELVARGAGRDVLIGVAMDRSLALITVLVAILKAGAAYVPLDPTLPRERLAFMLADAEAPIVVVDAAHRALIAEGAAEILTTEALLAIADDAAHDAGALACAVRGEDLAYVIYTSGSTGTR